MAPKKVNPMEEPPAASSSEEEEEETSEEVTSSEDEGEEGPQEQTEPSSPPPQQTQKQTAVKKPEITPGTSQSKSSSSEESGSETESDSEHDATPKPIASKPMEETPKATKSRSKPAAKRPNQTEEDQKDSKRAKKKGVDADPDEEKKPGEDTKKQLFQRLWSEEDEIVVLKGMIDYSTKKGVDPNQDMNAFHDYIKKSLHVDVSKAQLVDKIRRLKKKYQNNLEKGLKKGEDQTFSKPHEQKAYDLSKKLWGSESTSGVIESAAKSNGKVRKNQNQRGNNKLLASLKAELTDGAKEGDNMEVDNNKEGNGLDKSVTVKEKANFLFDKSFGVAGLEDFVLNNGLDMIGGVKRAELEERWKKLQIAQLELFLQRNELMKEQAKLILDALKSSGN
ncbi:mediator-associated protein 1 [Melia azedarach]|uniref:Mediator-associated protein 1 n=1 Tax=Melia azedarach TaxID=155640 RepID=A0ACC1WW08_MELAZ|nr:mediator-associated protein 1 [Melia azedarach]